MYLLFTLMWELGSGRIWDLRTLVNAVVSIVSHCLKMVGESLKEGITAREYGSGGGNIARCVVE